MTLTKIKEMLSFLEKERNVEKVSQQHSITFKLGILLKYLLPINCKNYKTHFFQDLQPFNNFIYADSCPSVISFHILFYSHYLKWRNNVHNYEKHY